MLNLNFYPDDMLFNIVALNLIQFLADESFKLPSPIYWYYKSGKFLNT